ncbi:unnamed protein product [Alopecurus aequalis]
MANGAQPAAGGRWLAAAPPELRARVIQKIMMNLPQVLHGRRVDDHRLHAVASQYEARVFGQSGNVEDYLRTISRKLIMCVQQKRQQLVQAAPGHQLEAHMGHQMQPHNAVLVNTSADASPQTASTTPFPQRPPQVQNMQFSVQQAHPSNFPLVAPVVTQMQTQSPARHNSSGIYTEQPYPQHMLMRMDHQQDLRVNQQQSYHTGNRGHPSSVATMQIGHPDGQNKQQPAAEVDWREEMFQKITSLKDAHLLEILEFERALYPQSKTDEQLKSLPEEQADQYKKAADIMASIRCVLRFLQLQKSNIPELAKDQFDKCKTTVYSLLKFYRDSKARNARKNVGLQSQNSHETPQVVGITGATDNNSQQKHQEHPAAEAFPHTSQNVPSPTPSTQQQNHGDHLAGEAQIVEVCREAEAPMAVYLTSGTGDAAPFSGEMRSQEIEQEHPTYEEAIPELTQDAESAVAPPALHQTHSAHSVHVEAEDDSVQAEAEAPVAVQEAPIKHGEDMARSLPLSALRSLASDMGVNMKRAFRHTTSNTMDGSSSLWFDKSSGESCCKRQKTHDGTLLDEIRATCSMLVETDISVSEDGTGGADGTVIELWYNPVSLTPELSAAICASEIRTKLLVPADYPQSSPVIIHGEGERRMGVPWVVDLAFQRSLGLLTEPKSIEEMAMAWDSVTRRAVMQFAQRLGGGTFSSRYCRWESCIPV